ncbi:MAG: Flp pilus assembly protein CpaB [Planctomycetaceae bacterium]
MKNLTPAKVSLMMFGVIGFLVFAFVAKRMFAVDEPIPEITTRNVPMLVSEVAEGTTITASHLGMGPVNIKDLTPDILLSNRVIIGRVAKSKLPAATPLRADALYQIDEFPNFKMDPNNVAVAVSLAESVAMVDGLIKPNQFVNVHLSTGQGSQDERMQGGLTLTLFRGVRILAINRNFSQGPIESSGNNVTLEMTPDQANIMILAQKHGGITLTYNPTGKGDGGLALDARERITLEQILGLKPIAKPAPPYLAEIFRGTGRTEVYFESGKRNARRVDRGVRDMNDYAPRDNDAAGSGSSTGTGTSTPGTQGTDNQQTAPTPNSPSA